MKGLLAGSGSRQWVNLHGLRTPMLEAHPHSDLWTYVARSPTQGSECVALTIIPED